MYQLVLRGLQVLVAVSIIFSFLGILPYNGFLQIISFFVLTISCYSANFLFAKIFKVTTNVESSSISSFILFFVLLPIESLNDFWWVAGLGVLSQLSKYVLAIQKKHIFNPVAITVFIGGLLGSGLALWWVGSSVMIIPVIILGFLVLRKVKRFSLFLSFIFASVISLSIFGILNDLSVYDALSQAILSGPIIFFGTIMLTEPLTTPPSRKLQIFYGIIVGGLFGSIFSFGPIYSTPALALIIGNVFSYIVSPRARLVLKLKEKNKLIADVYEFVWDKGEQKIDFEAGQYLEWTLGHKSPDNRGNRRYFTVASSPTERDLRLGVKFYDNSSSFKKKLNSMEIGETVTASQVAGEFTIPEDKNKKLVWIAGGIGVTPFRSMAKSLFDTGEKRNVVLFFSNRTAKDIVYKEIFDSAKNLGLKTIYAVGDLAGVPPQENIRVGMINAEMITKEVPDFKERAFYISGPRVMVTAFEETLSKLGVNRRDIKTDFFPGYV